MWVFFNTIPFTHLENIWSQFRYWGMIRGYIVINRLKTKKKASTGTHLKKVTKRQRKLVILVVYRCLKVTVETWNMCGVWHEKAEWNICPSLIKMARSLQKWKFAFQMICLSLAAVIRLTSTTWRNSFFSVSTSSCFLSTDLFRRHTVLFYVSSSKYLLS